MIEETVESATPVKREKKLRKTFVEEGEKLGIESWTTVRFEELSTGTELEFDLIELPAEVLAKLPVYGLGHKLGDAAAGKSGQDAIDAMQRVWEGMVANKWTVRQPKKDDYQEARTRLAGMSEEEQAIAKQTLADLGITI